MQEHVRQEAVLRFLKLLMLQPGKGKAVVEFKNSADTIFHDNDPVLKNAPDVLRQWITMLNGRIRQGDSAFFCHGWRGAGLKV